ncbi:MAG: radical SAM protein [Dehalococcoidia bacterium]|nr:radical SAM protein [Dehalococcoidia bacterium]
MWRSEGGPVTERMPEAGPATSPHKETADYVFHELTRSICPDCRRTVDAQVLLRDGKVYMRKRCPEHGRVEALVYADAESYVRNSRFNKPGEIPLEFATEVVRGCPHDCGLCPDHQQHACIIEVNSGCNMDCPLCFANAALGFSLTMDEVEFMLDRFVAAEGRPDVVQFSGGEPTIHPDIIPMVRAAQGREIPLVMINTNGRRIANDDAFVAELAEVRPAIYMQFDGFEDKTYRVIRGEPRAVRGEAPGARATGRDRPERGAGVGNRAWRE